MQKWYNVNLTLLIQKRQSSRQMNSQRLTQQLKLCLNCEQHLSKMGQERSLLGMRPVLMTELLLCLFAD